MEKATKKKEKEFPEMIHIRVNEKITEILKNQGNYSKFKNKRLYFFFADSFG